MTEQQVPSVKMVHLAKRAIDSHLTPGQFVRLHTTKSTTKDEYQLWSDAYQMAIHLFDEIRRNQEIQMQTPPNAERWQAASREIHKLATLLNGGVEPQDARGK